MHCEYLLFISTLQATCINEYVYLLIYIHSVVCRNQPTCSDATDAGVDAKCSFSVDLLGVESAVRSVRIRQIDRWRVYL